MTSLNEMPLSADKLMPLVKAAITESAISSYISGYTFSSDSVYFNISSASDSLNSGAAIKVGQVFPGSAVVEVRVELLRRSREDQSIGQSQVPQGAANKPHDDRLIDSLLTGGIFLRLKVEQVPVFVMRVSEQEFDSLQTGCSGYQKVRRSLNFLKNIFT